MKSQGPKSVAEDVEHRLQIVGDAGTKMVRALERAVQFLDGSNTPRSENPKIEQIRAYIIRDAREALAAWRDRS